jgi:tetratricopeptide (TPR) repeat protein
LSDAETLKEKVLRADAVNVFFRMNLVYYYTNSGNKSFAKEQIDELNKIGFKSKELYFVEALYYLSVPDKQEAIKKCDQLLEIDPSNRDALEIKRRAMLLN